MNDFRESNMANQELETSGSGKVSFGHHVVTLIDLLGQKKKLEEWDFLPTTPYDPDFPDGVLRMA